MFRLLHLFGLCQSKGYSGAIVAKFLEQVFPGHLFHAVSGHLFVKAVFIETRYDVLRGFTEGRRHDEGIGLVQLGECSLAGVRHTHYATEKLLDSSITLNVGNGTKNVCKGTIPPLLEGFNGNDKANLARRLEQVDIIQLFLLSGNDSYLPFRNVVHCHQVLSYQLGDKSGFDSLLLALSQNQRNGSQVFPLSLCLYFEEFLLMYGQLNGFLPVAARIQHDRNLNHFLVFQFKRGHVVQRIVLGVRCGRELQNDAGIEARVHLFREVCHRLVSLVHDNDGAIVAQQVRK